MLSDWVSEHVMEVVIGVGLVVGVVGAFWWKWPDDRLRVVVCDVGQGDSILIQRGFSQVLVDGGPGSSVLSCLGRHLPFWDRKIEMVVLTHPQADHMNGFEGVFERYQVELVVANGVGGEGGGFERFAQALIREGAKVYVPRGGDRFMLAGVDYKVLWPRERIGGKNWWDKVIIKARSISEDNTEMGRIDDLNQIGVVLELSYGDFGLLLTGDIGVKQELALLGRGLIREVEVLKVAHHGSKFSSGNEFLKVVKPELAVISVGRHNRFGHPTSDTLNRLDAVGAEILRTDEEGDVEIVSDGARYWVEE